MIMKGVPGGCTCSLGGLKGSCSSAYGSTLVRGVAQVSMLGFINIEAWMRVAVGGVGFTIQVERSSC